MHADRKKEHIKAGINDCKPPWKEPRSHLSSGAPSLFAKWLRLHVQVGSLALIYLIPAWCFLIVASSQRPLEAAHFAMFAPLCSSAGVPLPYQGTSCSRGSWGDILRPESP